VTGDPAKSVLWAVAWPAQPESGDLRASPGKGNDYAGRSRRDVSPRVVSRAWAGSFLGQGGGTFADGRPHCACYRLPIQAVSGLPGVPARLATIAANYI